MQELLKVTAHRPFPLCSRPWIMKQVWHDLLFAHWPIPLNEMRQLVPLALELDCYDGNAWLAVTPFHMSGIRARFLPPLPGWSAFPELNVRTYVSYKGVPGVYFFSLDAGNRTAVEVARRSYFLPYFYARMKVDAQKDDVQYSSSRVRGAAEFSGRYRPVGAVRIREKGSLEHFLTERYCLYAARPSGDIMRGHIHHATWPLQDAEAEILSNTVAAAAGIRLPGVPPILRFAKRLEVLVWWPERA